MSVFVTVGSTLFDELLAHLLTKEVLQLVASNGLQKIVLQIGRGALTPATLPATDLFSIDEGCDGCATTSTIPPVRVEWFRYKESLLEDIRSASLVIGHAGAGTVLESLLERRPLIAVLNERLMDNHQEELALQMEQDGHLLSCPCSGLEDALRHFFASQNGWTFPVTEPRMFSAFLEDFAGV